MHFLLSNKYTFDGEGALEFYRLLLAFIQHSHTSRWDGENKQLTLMSHTWLPFIVDDVNGVGGKRVALGVSCNCKNDIEDLIMLMYAMQMLCDCISNNGDCT